MRAAIPALIVFAALWLFSRLAPGLDAWAFGLAGLTLAVPLALTGIHASALRRHRFLHVLDRDGWIYRGLSGAVLRIAWNALLALVLALALLVRVIGQGWAEWAAVGVTAVSVPCAAWVWKQLAERQIAPEYRLAVRIRAARIGGSAAALAAYLLVLGAPMRPPEGPFHSALVEQAVLLATQWRLLEDFALGQLAVLGDWGRFAARLAAVAGNIVLAWTAAGIAAAFLLTPEARIRALSPVGRTGPGPAVVGWSAGILTILVVFIYIPGLAATEAALRALPPEDRPSGIFVTRVEEIGGQFFEPGTIAQITGRRMEVQAEAAPEVRERLKDEVDAGFDAMAANLDGFLDWYYSLPAEYAQIGHLLTGDFEAYLAEKMGEYLSVGDPFGDLDTLLARLEAADDQLRPALSKELRAIAAARRIDIAPGQPVSVTGRADAPVLLGLDGVGLTGAVAEGLKTRLAVSGGTAGLAGALTTAVMVKMGAKGVTKLAAKAAVKVATSKSVGGTAGAGGGAAAGALLGSVVPGLGTAAGALIGGVVGGLAVGVGTDYLLVKLEEALSRDTLKEKMVTALDASRVEVIGLIDTDPYE